MEVSSVVVLHLTPDPTYALVDFQDLVFSWIWAQVYLIVCFLTLLFIFVVVQLKSAEVWGWGHLVAIRYLVGYLLHL